jgi:hypothetical protein
LAWNRSSEISRSTEAEKKMSSTHRNIFIGVAILVLLVVALLTLRGCQPYGRPVAGPTSASAPPPAPQQSAADSARPGQIYFHRDMSLAKIIPGEGLVKLLPDAAASDPLNYQIQSDRLSPDATRIAFGCAVIRQIDGHFGSWPPDAIYVRRIDKSDAAELLVRFEGSEIHNFLWSPDSAYMAVVSWDKEHGTRNSIVDAASKQIVESRLPTYQVNEKEQTMSIAAWSPDGKWMVVVDDGWLYLIQIERQETRWSWTGRKRLTTDRQSILSLTCSFSPDGRHVAFVTIGKGIAMSLQVAAVHDSEQRTIVPAGKFTDLYAAWSPDSRRIAFSGCHLDKNGERLGRSGIYTVDAATTDLQPTPVLEEVHPPPVFRLRLIDWR